MYSNGLTRYSEGCRRGALQLCVLAYNVSLQNACIDGGCYSCIDGGCYACVDGSCYAYVDGGSYACVDGSVQVRMGGAESCLLVRAVQNYVEYPTFRAQ
eukprot:m.1151085 g.1151085  ORF g.1151085 m.1151085 type:complete len:99 (+) comp24479_c0_seq15:756-1052(+)